MALGRFSSFLVSPISSTIRLCGLHTGKCIEQYASLSKMALWSVGDKTTKKSFANVDTAISCGLHTTSWCCKDMLFRPVENVSSGLLRSKVQFLPTIDNRLLQGKFAKALEDDYREKHKPEEKITIYACKRDIKGSPKKLNLLARQIRRLPVDNAITQMKFSPKGLAKTVKKVLMDAKSQASLHNITDTSNLYVDESYVGRSFVIKSQRFHGKGRFGIQRAYHSHYFLKLKEGQPPKKPIKPLEYRKGHTKWMVTNMPPPKIVCGL